MEIQTPVNDGQAVDEGQQEPTEATELDASVGTEGEPAAPAEQQPNKPAQTPEQNAAYKARRIKAEQEAEAARQAADALIAEIYDGKFKTVAEYKAAKAEYDAAQEAERRGMTTEDYKLMTEAQRTAAEADKRAQTVEKRLATYERREEITRLSEAFLTHPKYGAFFTANKADVLAYAETLDPTLGTAQEQLEFATRQVIADKWEPPAPVDEAAIKAAGVKEHLEALKKQAVPVETRGGGIPGTPAPTGDAFKRAETSALSKLRGNKI
jgi:hypothetical protein